jgi:prepilin-type N-terminal cleavage/methylation domain-containing protein
MPFLERLAKNVEVTSMLNIRSRTVREPSGYAPRGLTLLELVVVMAILVALSAILVPLLPNLVSNANNATGAVNVAEVNKMLQSFQGINYQYPDGYDSMVLDTAIAPQVLTANWGGAAANLPVKSLNEKQIKSLEKAGITKVYNMVNLNTSPTASATFDGTDGTGAKTISTTTSLVTASPSYVQTVFGLGAVPKADLAVDGDGNPTTKACYVVLGIGSNCTLVGNRNAGVADAPVRGSPEGSSDPSRTYGRYAAVFRVDGSDSPSAAVLVGCACPGGMGLMAGEGMQAKYYKTVHQ